MSTEKVGDCEGVDVVDTLAIKMPTNVAGFENDRSRTVALIVQADRFRQALRSPQIQSSSALSGLCTRSTKNAGGANP